MSDTSDPFDMFLSIMLESDTNDIPGFSLEPTDLSMEDLERHLNFPNDKDDVIVLEIEQEVEKQNTKPLSLYGSDECDSVPPSTSGIERSQEEKDQIGPNFLVEQVSKQSLDEYVTHLKDLQDQGKLYADREGFIYTESESKFTSGADKRKITSGSKCDICGKPALKYSSYGGLACSSCRSFFRRSVQSGKNEQYICAQGEKCKTDQGTRKNCKYCRFSSCLKSGMKNTWVLSEQEKVRRFNKMNTSAVQQDICSGISRLPFELDLVFSSEEGQLLNDIHSKFEVPWLQDFLTFNRDAGFNLLEFVYGENKLMAETWDEFNRSFCQTFVRCILPAFTELDDLLPQDRGQLMHSPASGIARFFITSYCINIGQTTNICPTSQPVLGLCSVPSKMKALSEDQVLVNSFDLHGMLLKVKHQETRKPTYEDLYPVGWLEDYHAQSIHKDALLKMVNWPTYVVAKNKNMFDYLLVSLMSLILVFNPDFYTLIKRDRLEKVQMKYIMILKRYLRSKLAREAANTKFLEAMMLLAHTRQAWEISAVYRNSAKTKL